MDHHSREIVGRLAGWALLAVAVPVAAVPAAVMLYGGLPHSLDVAAGRAIVPDAIGHTADDLRILARLRPIAPAKLHPLFWGDLEGRLVGPYANAGGTTYLPLPASKPTGRFPLRVIPNPYAGYRTDTSQVWGYVSQRKEELLLREQRFLLDTRAILTPVHRPSRLASDSVPVPTLRSDIDLRALAGRHPLAYLAVAPLDEAVAIRRALGGAPHGPLILAGADRRRQPAADAVVATIRIFRDDAGRLPIFVTADAELAGRVAAAKYRFGRRIRVILIGPTVAAPDGVETVPEWRALTATCPGPVR